MTPAEFKAWFEGFCEAVDSAPTVAQWKRIKEQVAKLARPSSALNDQYPLQEYVRRQNDLRRAAGLYDYRNGPSATIGVCVPNDPNVSIHN